MFQIEGPQQPESLHENIIKGPSLWSKENKMSLGYPDQNNDSNFINYNIYFFIHSESTYWPS